MGFAVTADNGRFEWKGGGNWAETAQGLFAQPRRCIASMKPITAHATGLRCGAMRNVAQPSAVSTWLAGGYCCCVMRGCSVSPSIRCRCISAIAARGELALMIYEVRNTLGDIHAYVLPVQPHQISEAGVRQEQEKLFYVSPFIEMAMRYRFRVSPPGENVKLRVLETDGEGPLLAATFNGRRRALTTAALLRSLISLPLLTFKILAAIHWEGLRLWRKGARLVPRPNAAPANGAFNTCLATAKRNDYTGTTLSAVGRRPEPRESALVQ